MNPAAALTTASERGLRIFIAPPFSRRAAGWALIGLVIGTISAVDWFAGINLSFSLFYLLPISLAAGWYGSAAGVASAVVSLTLRLLGDMADPTVAEIPSFVWWNAVTALAIFLFVVWLVDSLVSAQRGLEGRIVAGTRELADAIADRRRLELELLDATARERAAVGRELHDELGQHLVATALAAQVLTQQLGDARGAKEARAIVGWIEEAIAKTRKLARGLLLAHIDAEHFLPELEELATSASQGGVRCSVVHRGDPLTATPGECAQLFRIAQESIGNALRHGRPRTIEIVLAVDAEATCLEISDDGTGYLHPPSSSGMGLRIMEHRAQIIGASLAVLSTPGAGTKVVCRLAKPRAAP